MANAEQTNIILVVGEEQKLYTPFSPEDEFDEPVKKYIQSKMLGYEENKSIRLTVVSRKPLDEERFRSAVSNWIRDETIVIKRNEKHKTRVLLGLLAFGSITFVLSLCLINVNNLVQYSLIPIMSSFSLSRAARVLILDMTSIRMQKWLIREAGKHNVISFEYSNDCEPIREETSVK